MSAEAPARVKVTQHDLWDTSHLVGLCIGIGDADWLPERERWIEPLDWAGYTRYGVALGLSKDRKFKWRVPSTISGPVTVHGVILMTKQGEPLDLLPVPMRSTTPGDWLEILVPKDGA